MDHSNARPEPGETQDDALKGAKKGAGRTRAPVFEPFVAYDFEALRKPRSTSAEYNEQRLAARRKLEAIAKHTAGLVKAAAKLDVRTSIHNPFPPVNGGRVERLWAYLTRTKAAKKKLARTVGADLAKDLDQAYRNGYLCVALEAEVIEVSFRIHPDGWFDGRNVVKRVAAEGYGPLLGLLNALKGFRLQLSDWKGEWICGELTTERMEEFFKYYEPGEHLLAVQKRVPVPEAARPAALSPEVPLELAQDLAQLVDVYAYAVWSDTSDFLFS